MSAPATVSPLQLFSADEVCELLSVSIHTLRRWRREGRGPAYIRLSQNDVKYRAVDIQEWINKNLVTTYNGGA